MSFKIDNIRFFAAAEENTPNRLYGSIFQQSICPKLYTELYLNRTDNQDESLKTGLLIVYKVEQSIKKPILKKPLEITFPSGQKELSIPLLLIESESTPIQAGPYECRIQFDQEDFNDSSVIRSRFQISSDTQEKYFQLVNCQLFEGPKPDSLKTSKQPQFNFYSQTTRHVIVEMTLKNKSSSSWNGEFSFRLSGPDQQVIGFETIPRQVFADQKTLLIKTSFGDDKPGKWKNGIYHVEILFQGKLIQALSFHCLDQSDIPDSGPLSPSEPLPEIIDIDWTKLEAYPKIVDDGYAVRFAYNLELIKIADYLSNGLSVLIVCERILVEYIYEYIVSKSGKHLVMDSFYEFSELMKQIETLEKDQVMVLRSLILLARQPMGAYLLYHTLRGKTAQFLAFLDPSETVDKVITNRFAVHISLLGLPRYTYHRPHNAKEYQEIDIFKYLVTKKEKAGFAPSKQPVGRQKKEKKVDHFDRDGLYKHVSKINVVQFRNAMKYISTLFHEPTDPEDIYREIRQFKVDVIGDDIEIPTVRMEDIGGYQQVKEEIARILKVSFENTDNDGVDSSQVKTKGFIFYGPPGTGKTLFAKAIANRMNATIQMISGPEIIDKWVGESEANLRRIFATARRNAPSVILFDEFDSIATKRTQGSDGGARVGNSVMAQLLTELDGFREDDGVLVIGTTNQLNLIDKALLRPSRLTPIKVGLPDMNTRKHVAQIHAQNFFIEKMVKAIFTTTLKYADKWSKLQTKDSTAIPEAYFKDLFQQYPYLKQAYDFERKASDYQKDLVAFFRHIQSLFEQQKNGQTQDSSLTKLTDNLVKMGAKYNLQLVEKDGKVVDMKNNLNQEGTIASDVLILFHTIHNISANKKLTADAYWQSVLEMLAEFTDQFNNDEIRAVFQEAWIDYRTKGQLVTPRFLGQKIGLIRRRKEEQTGV